VKDKRGDEVLASFYFDLGGIFNFNFPVHSNVPESLTNTGNTLAILYAEQRQLFDGSTGFRIEDPDHVQVRPILLEGNLLKDRPTQFFPCTLERLLALGDRILSSVSQSEDVRACRRCNTTSGVNRRCSGCHVTPILL
jgi:hypothetical protein